MKIFLEQGGIQQVSADAIIVNLFKGVTNPGGATGVVDSALRGAICELIQAGDMTGESGEVTVLYPRGSIPARRVLVVGLGDSSTIDLEDIRKAAAAGVLRARQLGAKHVATIVHGSGIGGLSPVAACQATVEASILATYRFHESKKNGDKKQIESLTVVEVDQKKIDEFRSGIQIAEAVSSGVFLARDLVNMPPNVATPSKLAEIATEIAEEYRMQILIGDRQWAAERKMGAYLAVAKGAGEPPKFIVLEHNGDDQHLPTVVLVGKGITFDTGGISIKSSERMWLMKSDMAGAAAVLGTLKTVGELDIPIRVIGITPCTENMPDANAYRPADVIEASNGKRIEVINTDAEGRMVLADGLVFAAMYNPKYVIDLATLTGASVVALGRGMAAGLFTNDETLGEELITSGDQTHERLWPLPLWEDYKKALESTVADFKNVGGTGSGVATSAIFLQEFTNFPWAHIDMAGMAYQEKDMAYTPSGATGFGVRLLTNYLLKFAAVSQLQNN